GGVGGGEGDGPRGGGRAKNPRRGPRPANRGPRRSSERHVRSRVGRSRPELRQVRLVPDLPRRTPAKMPGRRAGERGKSCASALGRGRQSVLVQPVAVVQDEKGPYTKWLKRVEEAIPCPKVVAPGLRFRGTPGEVDANPADPRCRHHLRL